MQDEDGDDAEQEKFDFIPRMNDTVYGRVLRVEDRFAKVQILAKGDKPMPSGTHFVGIIFKEQVRNFDRDNIVLHKCFAPNDIVVAKVIQAAQGGGQSVQLSTAMSDDLGVKYAWSQNSGQLMIPRSWTDF